MTSQVAMRTFLRDVIGISDADGPDPAASRGAIQQEYLGLFENLLEFDKDGIKSLYASVKKPGGKIEDPSNAGHWLEYTSHLREAPSVGMFCSKDL